MTEEELKNRTKELALRVIRLARSLPKDGVAKILGNQIVRSATSVAANYRSACKARSKADFISKQLGNLDETQSRSESQIVNWQ
jgi:four helix bundle protein